MLRLVLTPVLVLTLAAGPWLCCCTAAQLAALGTGPDQAAPPPAASCCGGGQPACDEEQASESRNRPHNRFCPCQEGRPTGIMPASVRAEAAGGDADSVFFDGLDAVLLGPASPLVASLVHPVLPDSPIRPSTDLLARLHILRC